MKKVDTRENGSKRVYTENKLPSKTDQQWKDDVDVNHIMDRYLKNGEIPLFAKRANVTGQYADVSNIPDLLGAYQQVEAAETALSQLPAKIRKRFQNDPQEMLSFLKDPKNLEESYELGFRERPAKETPKTETKAPETKTETKTTTKK